MNFTILNTINGPEDLKKLKSYQLQLLADELRQFIINIVSTKPGHLGASLGVVELTIALHYVFNILQDSLIWDVGHQAYGHKILTGRRENFNTLRQFKGISGFPKRSESPLDHFGTGHSSTSISAALGMAVADALKGNFKNHHIAVIGDASIASGLAFEGLNHAGISNANILIVLNDNEMGIDPSVGALKNYFTQVKQGKKIRKNNIIEALNFNYTGPVDGHNLEELILALNQLKSTVGPKFLHVITKKGKGLKQAEENQVVYHAPGKFNRITGDLIENKVSKLPAKYQEVFGETLVELADMNEDIVAITPAMATGSSLNKMIERYPNRAFDVGIAEQHAVTLAAGMATKGLIPFCVIYSTFLQRAYDQVIHDVALQKLPVIFCIDRAGIVGEDGATHHGVFDIAYLRCIPNLIIFAPLNEIEYRNILYTAQLGLKLPIAIRYPRGRGEILNWKLPFKKIKIGTGECITQGNEIAVLSIGTIGNKIIHLQNKFKKNKVAHYNMRFVKPLDEKLLHQIFKHFKTIVTLEDAAITGGFGTAILEFSAKYQYHNNIHLLGIPDTFIEHGDTNSLIKSIGLSETDILNFINSL
ncbi:MAG: 1-deoxy-D-xylulose-5-phosphate synthase [Lutibacter sp.]